jgi:hypothetical protein
VGVSCGWVAGRKELYIARGRDGKCDGRGGVVVGEGVCGGVQHYYGEVMVGNDE